MLYNFFKFNPFFGNFLPLNTYIYCWFIKVILINCTIFDVFRRNVPTFPTGYVSGISVRKLFKSCILSNKVIVNQNMHLGTFSSSIFINTYHNAIIESSRSIGENHNWTQTLEALFILCMHLKMWYENYGPPVTIFSSRCSIYLLINEFWTPVRLALVTR